VSWRPMAISPISADGYGAYGIWSDEPCREVEFMLNPSWIARSARYVDPDASVGPWVVEADVPGGCGNAVLGDARCLRYSAPTVDGHISLSMMGLDREEGDRIALSIFAGLPNTTVSPAPSVAASNGRIAFATGPDADIFVSSSEGQRRSSAVVNRHAQALFVIGAEGGTPRDVSPGFEHAGSPSWSPESDKLAFEACCADGDEIYVVAADGTGLRRVTDELDNGIDGAFMPAWSPDGARIAAVTTRYDPDARAEAHGILIMHTDGSQPRFVTRSSRIDEQPTWSPDRTRIAFLAKTPTDTPMCSSQVPPAGPASRHNYRAHACT
jgi:hypothetical protein